MVTNIALKDAGANQVRNPQPLSNWFFSNAFDDSVRVLYTDVLNGTVRSLRFAIEINKYGKDCSFNPGFVLEVKEDLGRAYRSCKVMLGEQKSPGTTDMLNTDSITSSPANYSAYKSILRSPDAPEDKPLEIMWGVADALRREYLYKMQHNRALSIAYQTIKIDAIAVVAKDAQKNAIALRK